MSQSSDGLLSLLYDVSMEGELIDAGTTEQVTAPPFVTGVCIKEEFPVPVMIKQTFFTA